MVVLWCNLVPNYENNSDFYMFREEQQQVEDALIGGIYIFTVCFTCGLWLFTILVETIAVMRVMSFLLYLYFVYRAIITNSFQNIYYFLQKYNKYKKVHDYFQQCKNHKQRGSIIDWDSKINTKGSEQPQKVFQKIELKDNEASPNKKLFFYRKINQEVKSKHLPTKTRNSQRQVIKQQYLTAREAYKTTVREFKKKGIQQNDLQYFCAIFKNKYTLKVKQLIGKSEQNIRTFKSILEENFEVKIVENKDNPQRLQPVHIDQAIKAMSQWGRSKCLPWAPRMKKEDDSKQVINRLVELVDEQQKYDLLLFGQFQVSQKKREKISYKILLQLQEKKNGKQLLKVLLEIYNAEVNDYQYKIGWELMNINGGLAIVESEIGDYMHADLKTIHQGIEKIYHAKPGEDNFWSLLEIAAVLQRLKR